MRRVTSRPYPVEAVLQHPANLSVFIRAARTQSGMTLEEAALMVGVSKQTMQKIETSSATVGFGIVLRVAQQLGVCLIAAPAEQQDALRRSLDNLHMAP